MPDENVVTYIHRGRVERCLKHPFDYKWCEGYSEDGEHGPQYPWMTRTECMKDARSRGLKARFVRRD